MSGERGGDYHISAYAPPELHKWLESHDGSKSETIVRYLEAIRKGEYVPKDSIAPPIDEARLTGVDLDNALKRKRLDAYDIDKSLYRQKMAADINLKTIQGKMTAAAYDRLLGGQLGGSVKRRWLYPSESGDSLEFFCPYCYKTIIAIKDLSDYAHAKQQLARHVIDKHGFNLQVFNHATGDFFKQIETTLLGERVPLTPALPDND